MIRISGLKKSFGDLKVLKGIDLSVQQGQVVAVIGPSGTGKSTMLRCLNYLERPDAGSITIDGLTVDAASADKNQIYALRRKSAMVFQDYNLFLNKTAVQNIMEPLVTVQKMPKAEARDIALQALESVSLLEKRDTYPAMLSGGQQQRIAIARAMAQKPKVMLFDEPTSALDPELVGEVLDIIARLAQQDMTMLIVTHEIAFARSAADRIVFMDGGSIALDDTPEAVMHSENPRVRQFLSRHHV